MNEKLIQFSEFKNIIDLVIEANIIDERIWLKIGIPMWFEIDIEKAKSYFLEDAALHYTRSNTYLTGTIRDKQLSSFIYV